MPRALTSTTFLGIVLAALAWPIFSILPANGPDPSWLARLYLAHPELQFGKDIVLRSYFSSAPTSRLPSPCFGARGALPLAPALVACYGVLVIGGLEAAAVLLVFAFCFIALGERPPRFAIAFVAVGGGVLAAIELLTKANYGIAILGFVALRGASRLPRAASALASARPRPAAHVLALVVLPGDFTSESLKPQHHLEYLRQDLDALLRSSERQDLIAEVRESLRAGYRLDPSILEAVRGKSAHVDPWEISLALGLWARLASAAGDPKLFRVHAAARPAQRDGAGRAGCARMIPRYRRAVAGVVETSVDARSPTGSHPPPWAEDHVLWPERDLEARCRDRRRRSDLAGARASRLPKAV
jgi:hypothetical protein